MTPAQRAALQWAIDTAQMKADVARRARNQASTAFAEKQHQADALTFDSHIEALRQILNGDQNA